MTGEVQPRSWPSISAKVSAKSAAAEVMTPGTSMRRGPESSRDSRMATAANARVARPTGTLMKKIQPQLRYSTEQATEQRTDRQGESADGTPDPDGGGALPPFGEGGGDDGQAWSG